MSKWRYFELKEFTWGYIRGYMGAKKCIGGLKRLIGVIWGTYTVINEGTKG